MHLVPYLPNVLCRLGFRKEVKSDVTAKVGVPLERATTFAVIGYSVGMLT